MVRARVPLSLTAHPGMCGSLSSSGLLIWGWGGVLWINFQWDRLQTASAEEDPGDLGFVPRVSFHYSSPKLKRNMSATLLLKEDGETKESDKTKPNKKQKGRGKDEKQINWQINSLETLVRN